MSRPAPRRRVLRAGLLSGAAAALPWRPAHAAGPLPEALLGALRQGGCLILLRHAVTESGVGDPPGFRLEVCATQRNLSAEGRLQAERLGAALRAAAVPIGPVRSSRWCRCLDTARLAFGRVEPWPVLDSFFAERSARGPSQTAALRTWALAYAGTDNAALVTHQVNVSGLTGEWVAPGEALVLRRAADALQVLGRLGG